jgi:hypothetical protein
VGGRSLIAPVALPSHPGAAPGAGGPQAHPLSGLAAYGVPIHQTAHGSAVVQGGMAGSGFAMPPNVPGMPQMPGPPDGLFSGGVPGGGLFQPMRPAAGFDPTNQVSQLQQSQSVVQPQVWR